MLIAGGVRLGLRCDLPGCKTCFHPRKDGSVRYLAQIQGWMTGMYVPGEDKQRQDFCCKDHFRMWKEKLYVHQA